MSHPLLVLVSLVLSLNSLVLLNAWRRTQGRVVPSTGHLPA